MRININANSRDYFVKTLVLTSFLNSEAIIALVVTPPQPTSSSTHELANLPTLHIKLLTVQSTRSRAQIKYCICSEVIIAQNRRKLKMDKN